MAIRQARELQREGLNVKYGVEMKRPAKVETTHPGETYANVAGTIFDWFVATADTTEPDWLQLTSE